jgi:hypothetical protein
VSLNSGMVRAVCVVAFKELNSSRLTTGMYGT